MENSETAKEKQLTKIDIWERKLLDFSLRNTMLNIGQRRRVLRFVNVRADKTEDLLHEGEEFAIWHHPDKEKNALDGEGGQPETTMPVKALVSPERALEPRPDEASFDLSGIIPEGKDYNSLIEDTPEQTLADEALAKRRLYTVLDEIETKAVAKTIYRAARTAVEETGANSLYLAIGTLRWYESEKAEQPRYAPVLLMPVEMVYKRGRYFLRKRDEETVLNITLVEFLHQMHGIEVKGLAPLPHDEHGVDVAKTFDLLREAVADQKRWGVEEQYLLGLFSFSKFLMWNDIHLGHEKMQQNPIIDSLVKGGLTWKPAELRTDLSDFDRCFKPQDMALPVAVDSSQMTAVYEAGRGNSFILYGPPGTGKSQTITNLIANALYQGKRVLFVAEKMAALEVVERRLDKIGLGPFCLELHSNKWRRNTSSPSSTRRSTR